MSNVSPWASVFVCFVVFLETGTAAMCVSRTMRFRMPMPIYVFTGLCVLSALVDLTNITTALLDISFYRAEITQIYTHAEYASIGAVYMLILRRRWITYLTIVSIVCFLCVSMWLKYLGVESTHDFDSLSAALEMILLFGLTFVTLFYSAQTVYGRENRHNWWILAVCASVFGYCLVNSWIFLNMFVLRDMSLWWVHHIIVILKLSVIVYTYLKLLP